MDEVLAIETHGLCKSDHTPLPRHPLDTRAHQNLAVASRENVATNLLLDWQSRAMTQSRCAESLQQPTDR